MPTILGDDNGSLECTDDLQSFDRFWLRRKKFGITKLVLSDTIDDDEDDILATAGIPAIYSSLRGCSCRERKAKEITRVRHPVSGVPAALWEVYLSFDNSIATDNTGGSVGQPQDPVSLRPTVRWHGEEVEKVLLNDVRTGAPIQTAAGEQIVAKDLLVLPILEITRYEVFPFDPDTILNYANHTNSQVFWGAPPGTALMLPMDVDEEEVLGTRYAKVTYRIRFHLEKNQNGQFRIDTIAKIIFANRGQKWLRVPNDLTTAQVSLDKQGNPIIHNLAADGRIQIAGGIPQYGSAYRKHAVDFNNLSLGPF